MHPGHHQPSLFAPVLARCGRPVLAALVMAGAMASRPALAQNQPLAVDGLSPYPPCPLVVPRSQAVVQPLRLRPSQVASKNALGCLSQFDAIYGANGCPLRLCPSGSGAFQLPADAAAGP
ncbi:MAG: hypothetical protein ACKO5F_04775 [Synechococcus sp.]